MGHSTRKLDLTGQKYGKLTVLHPAENIGTRTAWRCRCDCGKETVVTTRNLRSGHTRSCGCAKRGISNYLTYIDGTCVEILRSKTVRRNNTSGIPGIDWLPGRKRWRVSICFQGKRYYLGTYERLEDAAEVRREKEKALHGQFLQEFADRKSRKGDGD